jgi:hypothetical protein
MYRSVAVGALAGVYVDGFGIVDTEKQLGTDYSDVHKFKKAALDALKKVATIILAYVSSRLQAGWSSVLASPLFLLGRPALKKQKGVQHTPLPTMENSVSSKGGHERHGLSRRS